MEEKGIIKREKIGKQEKIEKIDPILEWMASIGEVRKNTLDAYGAGVFHRAMPLIRGRHPATIGPADAEIVARKLREKYGPATVNQTISALSSLWKHFQKRGIVQDNPWQNVSRENPENRVGERFLSRGEVKKLVQAAPNFRIKTFLLFLYVTGARVSEAVRPPGTPNTSPRGLRWKNIRFEPDGWAYATLYGKRGKTRTVGIRPEVAQLLRKLSPSPSPDNSVFPMTRIAAWMIIKRCAKAAGINKPVSPHWFRHTNAIHSLERGAPINVVQATLGHARLDTTGIYLRVRPGKGTGEYL